MYEEEMHIITLILFILKVQTGAELELTARAPMGSMQTAS